MQGGGRRQGQSLVKSDNAADAAPGLNPQGRVINATASPLRSFPGQRTPAAASGGGVGALRRCGSWRGMNIAASPRLASHPNLIPAPPSHD